MSRLRRFALPVLPVLAGCALLALAPALAALAVTVALGVLLAVSALGLAALVLLRRTVRRHPHLSRLGHRFERRYERPRVVEVEEGSGGLLVRLEWDGDNVFEVDAAGVPAGTSSGGPGGVVWHVPVRPLSLGELDLLAGLSATSIELVEEGTVLPQGPVALTRRLSSDSGVVLQGQLAPALV